MELEMKIKGLMIDPITNMPIIILRDPASSAVLPIWVGIFEANAIALQIEKIVTPRPMTHDLLKSMITNMQASVEKVVITDLKDNTFYALIFLNHDGKLLPVDSRPSDALNLAARVGAPILVDDAVMEHAFSGDRDAKLKEDEERLGLEPERPGEWRSLSPELVKELHPPPGTK